MKNQYFIPIIIGAVCCSSILSGCTTASNMSLEGLKGNPAYGLKREMYYLGTKWGSHWVKIHSVNPYVFWVDTEDTSIYRVDVKKIPFPDQFKYKSHPPRRMEVKPDGTIIYPNKHIAE
jgi:hypothetical protein